MERAGEVNFSSILIGNQIVTPGDAETKFTITTSGDYASRHILIPVFPEDIIISDEL